MNVWRKRREAKTTTITEQTDLLSVMNDNLRKLKRGMRYDKIIFLVNLVMMAVNIFLVQDMIFGFISGAAAGLSGTVLLLRRRQYRALLLAKKEYVLNANRVAGILRFN